MLLKKVGLFAAVTATLGGCATNPQTGNLEISPSIQHGIASVKNKVVDIYDSPDPCANNDRNIGATVGALAGAILGHEMKNNKSGTLVGALLGAGVGGLIGHNMDTRRCALYKIALANDLKLASATITEQRLGVKPTPETNVKHDLGLDVQLANKQDEFQPGTARLNPQARLYLGEIARQYTPQALEASLGPKASPEQRQQMAIRQVLIVGHTDERDNMPGVDLARLSQERAKAVAHVFAQSGVPARNIFYQGAGDSLPLSDNATAKGRADNNRVQIVDTPDLHTMTAFLQARAANPEDFESTKPSAAAAGIIGGAASQPQQGSTLRAMAQIPRPIRIAPVVAHAASPKIAAGQVVKSASVLGLNGQPMGAGYNIGLGAPITHSLFSIIRSAYATAPVIVGPCWQDHPHGATQVRNLSSGEALPIRNAMHGLYGEPWWGQQNDSAVALLHTYAPRDGGAQVPPTTVEFYAKRPGTTQWRLTAKDLQAPVNIYRGSRFTLYRVFLRKRAQCVDLAVPNATASSHGYVIYQDAGREYGASLQFTPRG